MRSESASLLAAGPVKDSDDDDDRTQTRFPCEQPKGEGARSRTDNGNGHRKVWILMLDSDPALDSTDGFLI